jgi:MFS transporter, ceroid-lipofuscinosis neuronal protein 7
MTAGLVIQILSNAIYGCMENFSQTDRKYIMLASRILVGFGSGNVAVMRAYAANASTVKDRAKAITMISASWVRFFHSTRD